ncbi:MAG TPA: DNA polymerase Y family protein [Burkholderiales bacterium]|nr:DNA polymerase Y family protein [Burkholderiales bacterium]
MLWIALRLPHLALETLSRARHNAGGTAWAIVEDRRVFACDAQAAAQGVRSGMGLAAAWALSPRLQVHERNPAAERAALEGIAVWLCRFTPAVSLEPPQGVLAEVQGSLRRFGGLPALAAQIRSGIAALGFSARLSAAPSARGAWLLTFGATDALLETFVDLQGALVQLPVETVCATDEGRALLKRIGTRAVGELLELPRTSVARRLGPEPFEHLDRALGVVPEARRFFVPPERFAAVLELPAEVEQAEGLLFAAHRLLLQLEGLLSARQSGIRRFCVVLEHRRRSPERIEVGLASPGCEAERFVELLRERLSGHALAAPVAAIRVEADGFVLLSGRNQSLFGETRGEAENWQRLVERLQARLGENAVTGLGLNPDYRPERAWRPCSPDEADQGVQTIRSGPRPLWLVEPPQALSERNGVPQQDGSLEMLAGPERIESGWWDGAEVRRDYFIARATDATLLWIYRTPGGGWYLHGLFA